MTLSIIAAIGQNNELGKDNKLLWDLPADMKHFRETTRGHAVIMGRKTFESIGHPLPNRRNIVITRDALYKKEGIEIAHSVDEALEFFKDSNEEIFCIGGADIYTQAIPKADTLYITHVAGAFDADTFFPPIDSQWKEVSREIRHKDNEHSYDIRFTMYKKSPTM